MMFLIAFIAGIGNFAMQKAVFESRHPFIEQMKHSFGPLTGERISMVLDLAILSGVLIFISRGDPIAGWVYLGYTGFNAAACWAILTDRL